MLPSVVKDLSIEVTTDRMNDVVTVQVTLKWKDEEVSTAYFDLETPL